MWFFCLNNHFGSHFIKKRYEILNFIKFLCYNLNRLYRFTGGIKNDCI